MKIQNSISVNFASPSETTVFYESKTVSAVEIGPEMRPGGPIPEMLSCIDPIAMNSGFRLRPGIGKGPTRRPISNLGGRSTTCPGHLKTNIWCIRFRLFWWRLEAQSLASSNETNSVEI